MKLFPSSLLCEPTQVFMNTIVLLLLTFLNYTALPNAIYLELGEAIEEPYSVAQSARNSSHVSFKLQPNFLN